MLLRLLKDLGFLDENGTPQKLYFEFLDETQSKKVLAKAIRHAWSDLFSVNKNADKMTKPQVKSKLKTLYEGSKTKTILDRIASTFVTLCEYADFSDLPADEPEQQEIDSSTDESLPDEQKTNQQGNKINLKSLQYHINIILPESANKATYDAIFKSLREHLG